MAYVTPSTVTAGDAVTAAAWNVVAGDIIETAPFFSGWTTYTPTLTSATGSPTTAAVVDARYCKIGRVVILSFRFSVTTVGTAGGAATLTLPSGITITTGAQQIGIGREVNISGKALTITPGTTNIAVNVYDNSTPWVASTVNVGTIVFEAAA